MVDSSTQTFIWEVLDAQINYDIKFITMITILGYALFLWYMTRKMEPETWTQLLFKLMAKLTIYPTFVFFPLYLLLLLRDYTYIEMWTNLLIAYSVVWFTILCIGLIFSFETIFKMFKLDFSYKAFKTEKVFKEELVPNWKL